MANFSEIVCRLQQKPERMIPGADRDAWAVCYGVPDGDALNTAIVLSEHEDRLEGAYAGIVSVYPIEAECPVAVFPAGTDLRALQRELNSAIIDEAALQAAKAELMSVFLDTQDVQALVEKTHEILGLPVTVFDLSTKVVAFSGAEQVKRSAFGPALYVLDRGFAVGYTNERSFNEQTRRFAEAAEPFVNTFGGGLARLCCRISVMGEFAGHINIMGSDRDFKPSDYAIERLLRDLIEKLWQRESRYFREPAEVLLQDVYDGVFDGNKPALEERLRLLRLTKERAYCVLFVPTPEPDAVHPPLKSLMNQLVHYSVGNWEKHIKFFARVEGAYCLISIPDEARLPELVRQLEAFFKKNGCRGALSKVFYQVTELRLYCDQTRRLAQGMDRWERGELTTYEARYWDDVIRCLEQTAELHSFVGNEVLLLAAYDRVNDSRLVDSLCTYLTCGRNISEASKRLFIHRNTLIRRLERISRITGRDFDLAPDVGRLILDAKIVAYLNERGRGQELPDLLSEDG